MADRGVLGQSAAERIHLDPDLRERRRPGGKDKGLQEGGRGCGYHAQHQRREDGSPRSRDGLDVGLHGCRTTRTSWRERCLPGCRTLLCNRMMFPAESEAMASCYRACKVCKPDQYSG